MALELIKFLPWLPLLGAVLCGICCLKPQWRRAAGPVCVISLLAAFALTVLTAGSIPDTGNLPNAENVVTAFNWITVGQLDASFGYLVDHLTLIMLLVVTGIGSLVAMYAMGYMHGDRGYARFFAYVSLFIFAMTTLVMADNLILLYLGWEGVGLCSYLLIGYYYDKPSAVAAAKKAFIVNRVGDLGFAIGIFLTFWAYNTVSLTDVFAQIQANGGSASPWADLLIPFCLMLGAFGKSAQIPLYVWLPDAMEGPTPVSALIHAATMVTAGVYMIARMIPVFQLSTPALMTVTVIGTLTALMAATIALCQYDIKRIWAYSTVSQLGYMFMGVGVLSTVGGVFHVFTHAFFKALLFLTAGSVMHAMAGQLDLRKMSGLRHKMPVTCWLMFVGALALAGVPLTAGFFSKDLILAATLEKGLGAEGQALYIALGAIGLITAGLTAYYTFRLWFRVFLGPEQYEMGEEDHAAHDEHGDDAHGHAHEHAHGPHEMPWWPMNAPLVVLAIGAIFAGWLGVFGGPDHGWVGGMIHESSAYVDHAGAAAHGAVTETPHAAAESAHGTGAAHAAASASHGASDSAAHHGPTLLGLDLHVSMQILSGLIALVGIAVASYFHWLNRSAADQVAEAMHPIVRLLENKYYVDELYDRVIVQPLRFGGYLFYVLDQLVINGIVYAVAWLPRLVGRAVRPTQHGVLQGYGLGMALGLGAIVLVVLMTMT